MDIVPADSLDLPALAALFNAGFSEYVVPLQLDVGEGNTAAIALYDKLAFAVERELVVWSRMGSPRR